MKMEKADLRLEHDRDALSISRQAVKVGRSLDDTEELLSAVTEAPAVGVDILGNICRPRLLVDPRQPVQELPEDVVVLIHRSGRVVVFREEDEGGVRAKLARDGKVGVQRLPEGRDMARVREVIRVNEEISLLVALETLRSVDAGEDSLFVE